ncbi:flavin reductase family protein [Tistrella bauzanensis]|uniref:Flavin reductase family protein n=1 Tax=Tistrella arctica TaxID=3133430 RepID=A0ABU9YNN3_9PROT
MDDATQTAPVAPAMFRAGLRRLAGGVTIIATGSHGARAGLTATAVMSLTAEPPRLAVAINRNAGAHDLILGQRRFTINLLAADHGHLARLFAGGDPSRMGEARFDDSLWTTGLTGAPLLAPAAASLDCRLVDSLGFESHTLLVGAVVDVKARDAATALIYHDGCFAGLTPID